MSNVHSVFIGPTYLMAVNTILVLYYNSIGAEHFLLLKGHIKLFQPSKFGLGLMFDLKIMNNLSQVSVTISDVNDRRPVFDERDARDANDACSIVTEFHELNEAIMTVRATDGDDPATQNGQVVFKLVSGNEANLFRLETSGENYAKIYPNQSLKGNYGNYTLTVQADDRGNPPNSATAQYSICVQVIMQRPILLNVFVVEFCLLIYGQMGMLKPSG